MTSYDQNITSFSLLLSLVFMGLLSVIMVKSKAPRISVALLVSLMACQVYYQFIIMLKANGSLGTHYQFLFRSEYPFELSSPPLVYLYARSLTQANFKWRDIHWFHATPFVLGCLWYFFGSPYSPDFFNDRYYRTFFGFVVMVPYVWFLRKNIFDIQITAKNYRSSLIDLHLPWLKFLLVICYSAVLLTFFDLLTGPEITLWLYRGVNTNLALLGLTYFGLRASEFFASDLSSPSNGAQLDPKEANLLSAKLLTTLKQEELYLKPQIRLAEIADRMGIKSYKLSEVINQGLNTNFYDLINGLRLEHAMKLMRDPSKDHLNLLGIAMDSGFNSKSVFNDFFRRKTGLTPSEFRLKTLKGTALTKSDDRSPHPGR